MESKVGLPDLYRTMTGVRKKQMAWSYLQKYYPAYIPDKEQPFLYTDNCVVCTIDFEKQRAITAEVNERRNQRKKK